MGKNAELSAISYCPVTYHVADHYCLTADTGRT